MNEVKEVKKTKKKNKVASLLLALALILTCGVAGTIAQYQKTVGGNSSANVANFNVSDGDTVKNINLFDTNKLYDSDAESATKGDSDVASGKIAPGTQGYADITLTNNSEVTVKCDLTAVLTTDTDDTTPTGQILASAKNSYVEKSETYKGKYIPLQYAVEATTGTLSTVGQTLTLPSGVTWSTANESQDPFAGLSTALETAITAANAQDSANTGTTNIGMSKTMNVRIYWKWDIKDTGSTDARNELDTVIGEAMANTTDGDKVFREPRLKVDAKFTQVD